LHLLWPKDREADLLPVSYCHVVFTVPAAIAQIAFQNKAAVCDLLFKAAAASARPPRRTPGARR